MSNKSMMAISSHRDGAPTFRMLPISLDCPYGEVVYVPQVKALVVFHKHTVEGLHMVPKLDDNGDPVRAAKPISDGNPYKQERKALTTPHESYITHVPEIEQFMQMFMINDKFDYKAFMVEPKAPIVEEVQKPKIILPS